MESEIELSFDNAKKLFVERLYSNAFQLYSEIYNNEHVTRVEKIRALNNMSLCCACEKNYIDAEKWAIQSLSLDANNVRALIRAALACEGQRKYNEGLQYLTRANELETDNREVEKLMRNLHNARRISNDTDNNVVDRTQEIVNNRNSSKKCKTKNDGSSNNHEDSKINIDNNEENKRLEFYFSKNVEKGKAAMLSANYNDAIRYYTKAIDLHSQKNKEGHEKHISDTENKNELAVLLCNRSAAYFHEAKYTLSLNDAQTASELNELYSRAYYRQACALNKLHHYIEAFNKVNRCLAINHEHKEAINLRAEIKPHVLEQEQSAKEKLESHLREVNEIKEKQRLEMTEESAKSIPILHSSAHATAYTYCNYCNERGHTRNECPLRQRKRFRPS